MVLTQLVKFNTRIERPPSYSSADTEELVHRARAVMGPTVARDDDGSSVFIF